MGVKKWWFWRPRFSLWALLVLITTIAIPLSYVAQRRAWNSKRKAAYEVLQQKGFQFESPGVSVTAMGAMPTSWQRWWRTLLLDDLMPPLSSVNVNDEVSRREKLVDDDLLLLTLFPEIKSLRLEKSDEITDRGIAVVENLPQLESLWVVESPKISSRLLELIPPLNTLSLEIQFNAAHIPALQKQTELVSLRIQNAALTDDDLSFLGECDQLDSLELEGLPVSGFFLAKLNPNAPMHFLKIRAAPLTDKNAVELRRFSRLVHLDLAWTTLEGEFLPEAGAWPMLQFVDFQGVRFNEAGKRKLAQLSIPFHVTYPSNWSAKDLLRYDTVKLPSDFSLNSLYAEEAKANSITAPVYSPPNFQPPRIGDGAKQSMAGVIRLLEMAKAEEAKWKAKEKQDDGRK